MAERTITDAEALDQIRDRYKSCGEQYIFENVDSTIEFVGDIIEQTGRKAWFEHAEWESEGADRG